MQGLRFSLEVVDGDRCGRLFVPFSQVAQWINFLVNPHYNVQVIAAEQGINGVEIYFQACEGLYGYLADRIDAEVHSHRDVSPEMALAS
jgi:hypothetical protein